MTTLPPVNPRATVSAVFVDDLGDIAPAGHWHFYGIYGEPNDAPPAGMLFGCPCGCGMTHSAAFRSTNPNRPTWGFNGDKEKPTLTPSLNVLQTDEAGNRTGEHWHGWLRDGVFVSC